MGNKKSKPLPIEELSTPREERATGHIEIISSTEDLEDAEFCDIDQFRQNCSYVYGRNRALDDFQVRCWECSRHKPEHCHALIFGVSLMVLCGIGLLFSFLAVFIYSDRFGVVGTIFLFIFALSFASLLVLLWRGFGCLSRQCYITRREVTKCGLCPTTTPRYISVN